MRPPAWRVGRTATAEPRRIAVTGATGFVARHTRRLLSRDNAELVSISRKKFRPLRGERAILAEDYAVESLLQKIGGADAVIHLAGIGIQTTCDGFAANHTLARKIVELCRGAGVTKIVYLSGLGASRHSPPGYLASKYMAEREIMRSGLDYTIFRPSYIVGGGDLLTKRLKKQAARGHVIVPGSGRFTIQPIYIGDAAAVISESIESPRLSRKTLDLVGPEVISYGRYAGMFAGAAGAGINKVPLEEAYREAVLGRGGFDVEDLNLLVGSFSGDHARLQRTTGLEFERVTRLLQSGSLL